MTMRSNPPHIEEEWQRLDPVFIMGRQRTGTSITWRALRVAGLRGFPEGHLWFDLVEAFARFRNPSYQENVRQEIFTLGSGRNRALEQRFALMMDRFQRDFLGGDLVRWVDKSPGVHAVRLAPMVAELFPRAQFIFMMRNPITTVNSAVHYVPRNREDEPLVRDDKPLYVYRTTCQHWVRVMELWRQVRPLLGERALEIAQEEIVERPVQVSERLAAFLGIPESARELADVFQSRRENTAFPDREVGDFFYPVDWTGEQKRVLAEVCGEEMALWGYPLDFERPGGPRSPQAAPRESPLEDMATYYRWLEHQNELIYRSELAMYKETLARVEQGRVMRTLKALERLLARLGLGSSREESR